MSRTPVKRRPRAACLRWAVVWLLLLARCDQVPRGSTQKNRLEDMPTTTIEIVDKTSYTAWIARDGLERTLGLMNVTEDELPDDRGMIFVFEFDRLLSFWMRNTIIPLDIAYIRSDGTIVKTYTMQPLNEAGYPSIEPAQFALEVRAGELDKHGIGPGDKVILPPELFE